MPNRFVEGFAAWRRKIYGRKNNGFSEAFFGKKLALRLREHEKDTIVVLLKLGIGLAK